MSTQIEMFGPAPPRLDGQSSPETVVPGISWRRFPSLCRANYQMLVGGEPNGVWVRECGHPTALRPYYVVTATGEILMAYRTVVQAKQVAVDSLKPGE